MPIADRYLQLYETNMIAIYMNMVFKLIHYTKLMIGVVVMGIQIVQQHE